MTSFFGRHQSKIMNSEEHQSGDLLSGFIDDELPTFSSNYSSGHRSENHTFGSNLDASESRNVPSENSLLVPHSEVQGTNLHNNEETSKKTLKRSVFALAFALAAFICAFVISVIVILNMRHEIAELKKQCHRNIPTHPLNSS